MDKHNQKKPLLGQTSSRRGFLQKTGLVAALSAGAMALPQAQAAAAPVAPTTTTAGRNADFGEVPADARATMGMFRALTLKAFSSATKDRRLRDQLQNAAAKELDFYYVELQKTHGGIYGYTPHPDDICPPWWPWPLPFPPRQPWPLPPLPPIFHDILEAMPAADKLGKVELATLDVFQSLQVYTKAFMISDLDRAAEVQSMVINEMQGALDLVMNGEVAMWEPGDDICPPWWGPIIWQGPLVGPSASPEPLPLEPEPWPWKANRQILIGAAQYVDAFEFEVASGKAFKGSALGLIEEGFSSLGSGLGSYGYIDGDWWCGNDPLFWLHWFRNRLRPRKPRVPIDPRVFNGVQTLARDVMTIDMSVRMHDQAMAHELQAQVIEHMGEQIGMLP